MRRLLAVLAVLPGCLLVPLWPLNSVSGFEGSTRTQNPTLEAVVRGMLCTQSPSLPQQMNCEYRVGPSLHFAIAGVGQRDAAITFFHVDWDGEYYASVGVLHGCVIVKPGKRNLGKALDMAFVSPKTGKVYGNWQTCD